MLKRSYSSTTKYAPSKRAKAVNRSRIYRAPRTAVTTITRAVRYSVAFSADVALGFGVSPTYLWINNTSTVALDGAADMTSMFDLCRVKKIEMIILPAANVHELSLDVVGTQFKNIPYVYIANDKSDSSNPTQASIMQMDGLRITSLDHPIRHTIYSPKCMSASSVQSTAATWVATGSDVPFNGVKLVMDITTPSNYTEANINFIVTFECKDCK